ncbi:MAG: NnrU family protein [Ignavibacteria bacterium]|nr:NnrU family protein [Ignavibacteria bacterium]
MENKKYIIFAGVCVLTHVVRTVYEILKYKKKIRPGKLSFAIIFADMALLWLSWFALCGLDTFKINLSVIIMYAGMLLAAIGFGIFLTALFTIKAFETHEGDLMTKGIYSKLRHPMYLGFVFWLIGFPVYCGAGLSMILAVIFVANVLLWRYLEEKELIERYLDYAAYKKTTWF